MHPLERVSEAAFTTQGRHVSMIRRTWWPWKYIAERMITLSIRPTGYMIPGMCYWRYLACFLYVRTVNSAAILTRCVWSFGVLSFGWLAPYVAPYGRELSCQLGVSSTAACETLQVGRPPLFNGRSTVLHLRYSGLRFRKNYEKKQARKEKKT